MTTAANSAVAAVVAASGSPVPVSFNGDSSLYLFNLVVMTAAAFIAATVWSSQVWSIVVNRLVDRRFHPVTLHRGMILLFSLGISIRCAAEAMILWGWSPADSVMTAKLLMTKRWLDPIAVACGMAGLAISKLSEPGMEEQLRVQPFPVEMWSRLPVLLRAAGIIAVCLVAGVAAVALR